MAELTYTLRYTNRRRSLALVVLPCGGLEVRAPRGVSRRVVERFVAEKAGWVEALRQRRAAWPTFTPRTWAAGDVFYYHGTPHTLCVYGAPRVAVDVAEGVIRLGLSAPDNPTRVRHNLMQWYKQQAYAHFAPLLAAWAAYMGEKTPDLLITNARGRWGSCVGARREVRLSLRLLMAPQNVQDYVIVHELAHLAHMDHSPAFWAHVAQHYPNYKAVEAQLRENANLWRFD